MTTKHSFTPLLIESCAASATSVARAIAAGDDNMALHLAAAHPDQQLAWSQLANACTRRCWLHQGRPLFGQLMAIPVVHEDAWPESPPTFDNSGCQALTDAINACLQDACALLLFTRMRNYACVCAWSPSILEEHLRCVHDRQLPAPQYTQMRSLLAGSVQLSFIFVVVVSRRDWPNPPTNAPEAIVRVADVIRQVLNEQAPGSPCLEVQPPQPLQEAIASGLCAWLTHVHAQRKVQSWKVTAAPQPADAVRVEISFGRNTTRQPHFTVRKHQVGLRGLQAITFALSSQAQSDGSAPQPR